MTGWPEWNFGATQIVARPPSVMDNSVYPRRLPSQRVFALSSGSTAPRPTMKECPATCSERGRQATIDLS
jgi:hypothetical protein